VVQGAKSLLLLAYQLLTENIQRFKRWASLKAYFIINLLEVVFWVAVAALNVQSNLKRCQGTTCALSWVVVVMAGIIQYVFSILLFLFHPCRRGWSFRGGRYGSMKDQPLTFIIVSRPYG
jgi:hypothetical protein